MIQFTHQMERIFKENPLHSKDGQGKSAKVIAKFYLPGTSMQWLITEASQEDGQWILYGYCHIFEWEWGYVSLNEMLETNTHGLYMEVKMFESCEQKTVSEFILDFF